MPAMAIMRSVLLGGALLLSLATLPACRTLTAGNGVLTGSLNYPSGVPAGSMATIELVRIETGMAPTLITRTSVAASPVSPTPFVLNYDPTVINPQITHALRAMIAAPGGAAMYATAGDVPITFEGVPIALDLYGATGGSSTSPGGTTSTPRR
ncbi:MAG TPA: YbaY family lipoprotein [Candidatus Kapabacteria bacterium]|nr:YbaY family lipoprotein [Candidatus Kapabacteria bacterium]